MTFRRHSQTAQAAYHDLVSLLLDESVTDLRGAPTARRINGKTYWYDRYRLGSDIHEKYLGEETPALLARLEQYEALKEQRANRRRERTRLVRLLRSERFLGLDGATGSLVAAFARTGAFRLGGVLVGTTAFRLYEGELGLRLSLDQAVMTNDIDIASFEKLSLALGDVVDPSLHDVLDEFDFAPVPSIDKGRVWRWRQSSSETLVEFLTPSFDAEEGIRELPALGVSAQSLHHLNFLIAEPLHAAAVYRDGILVRIPRPERFAIHKLIVSNRRRDGPESLKARKDLLQAELLIEILAEDRPGDLAEAYADAVARGPRWREHIEQSLVRSPASRQRLDALRHI
ncbi:nucleotidyltransferase family protein [Henriciella aquimarina]|uniref:nucleotidyltransferase family protein n=1 Tax=Henriciella aquimarina TaxID=545261 RepID=UPI000A01B060|nr:GSU2403 family nucleotidyltransferase fold protein [Henriciella aquimarina]